MSSDAVFFLGTGAHYQVLHTPETSSYDIQNANASTETIYQNPSVQELWPKENTDTQKKDNVGNYLEFTEEKDSNAPKKRRSPRRLSEIALCEEMKPAQLNHFESDAPNAKTRRRLPILTLLSSLARRKQTTRMEQTQYLTHMENALMRCTYRESCRCLECQSRYFECDESDSQSSDDDDYTHYNNYSPEYMSRRALTESVARIHYEEDDDDDEVFVDQVPSDNTSTDLLIEGKEKMSISSDDSPEALDIQDLGIGELEVAAGTPVLLNYLLTHPITCSVQ